MPDFPPLPVTFPITGIPLAEIFRWNLFPNRGDCGATSGSMTCLSQLLLKEVQDDGSIEMYAYGTGHILIARHSDLMREYFCDKKVWRTTEDHRLAKVVAGSETVLGTEAVDLDKWTAYRYKLELSGNNIKSYRDDMVTPKLSAVDTDIPEAGRWGFNYLSYADETWIDIHIFELKLNGNDVTNTRYLREDEDVTRWGLFPCRSIQAGARFVTTLVFKGAAVLNGWTEYEAIGDYTGASMRFKDHANHYWIDTRLPLATADVRLGKSVNGVETMLAQEAVDLDWRAKHKYKIDVNGNTVKGFRDDVEKFSVVDTDITDPGYQTIYEWAGAAGAQGSAYFYSFAKGEY